MLLKQTELEAIRAGTVSVVFRRWRRPTVKTGGTLLTSIGQLAIDRVTPIDDSELTANDVTRAGFDSLESLRQTLSGREGELYRIELHWAGADPRHALREQGDLDDTEFQSLKQRLERLDARSSVGPWTETVLRAVERHPHLAAVQLAELAGFPKDWLKTNVRKLKNLGLTISHHPGYELSPRGRAVLARLADPS